MAVEGKRHSDTPSNKKMKESEQISSASPADDQEDPDAKDEHSASQSDATTDGKVGEMGSEASETTEQIHDLRNTSSNFASLRAAFEQGTSGPSTTDGLKRRLTTNDGSGRRGSEKDREYEAEIGRLKDGLEKEKELRIAYEEKVTSLEEEVDDLTTQLEEREEMWRDEYTRSSVQAKKEAENRLSLVAGEARAQRQEASNLQRQLFDLKRSVSTSTRTSGQVSDSTFKQEVGLLQHEVQNWVVNNFRRVKIESSASEICEKLEHVVNPNRLERLKRIYEAFEPTVKLPILQATVACYMLDIFEDPYLFGLDGQLEWVKNIRDVAESFSSMMAPAVYNRWRSVTFDSLRQNERMAPFFDSSADDIAEIICVTLKSIAEVEDTETRLTSLRAIVKRAISLAHMVRVQQAHYQFALPSPQEAFDATTMDDIADDSDAETERTVRFATFPSLMKIGDEEGDHVGLRNLVAKAKVLCYEGDP